MTSLSSYLSFSISLLKSDNDWFASVYVKNVGDKLYTVAENQTSLFIGNQIFGQFGAPRTYGVSVTKLF